MPWQDQTKNSITRKMNLKKILLVLALFIASVSSQAMLQDTLKPEPGKPMPDFFLSNITYFKTSEASLTDFKGKWLILDFWFSRCLTCIQSFPKVNEIHKEFMNELNWIMVGLNDKKRNSNTQEFYEKIRKKQNLEMPVAYDSILANRWNIHSMPHIIIVDPSGTVYSITGGRDLTSDKIRRMLKGEQVTFYPKNVIRPEFNPVKALSGNGLKNQRLLLSSVLSEWNGEGSYSGYDIDYYVDKKIFEIDKNRGYDFAMVPLYALYNYAYWGRWRWDADNVSLYGKVYPRPTLELTDTSLFQYDEIGTGTYNYSLSIPQAEISKGRIMSLMQEDLKRVFKYHVSIETRDIPIWKLIARPGAIDKLKTKGGERFITQGPHIMGYSFKNVPSSYLVASISFYIAEKFKEPFIDETNIAGNIDFTIEADMTNFNEIKKAIQLQGLDLVKSSKKMKVIVIRDPK
jgi:thioredoxin-related protein